MPTALTVTGDGTTLYLNNSSGSPTAGGAATGAATTPWVLVNDSWTIQAAIAQTIYSGGPPFRDGATPIARSFPNVTQVLTLALIGSSHDNVAARLQELSRVLNTAIGATPCVLAIKPNGATNTMYSEIYAATVQPTTDYQQNAARGSTTISVAVTLTRSPFFGLLGSGETLINAQTFTVAGSTTTLPSNVVSLAAGSGELVYDGQPLNLKVAPTTSGSDIGEIWLASIAGQVTATINTALSPSTPVTGQWTPTAALTRNNSKLRVIARVSNAAGGAISKYWIVVRGGLSAFAVSLFTSAAVSPTTESTGLVDFGEISLDALRAISPLTGALTIEFYASKNLGSTNLISVECLSYYDFCKIQNVTLTQSSSNYLWVQGFRAKANQVCLPSAPSANLLTSTDALYASLVPRGQLPRYFAGASLWANWLDSTGNNTATGTRAASITATHAPLYRVLRGAG